MKGVLMRRFLLSLLAMLSATGLLFITSAPTAAQTTSKLVGTWAPVTITNIKPDGTKAENIGPHPIGLIVFTKSGHCSFVEIDPNLPKIAANNRNNGTAEENQAIVQRSVSYFCTYKDDAAHKTVTLH